MSQLQKYAWFNLGVCALAAILFLAALPFAGLRGAQASFGVFALWALNAYILRTRRDGKVTMDERDRQIWGVSLAIAGSIFWVAFVAACMLPRYIYGWNGSIPVRILPLCLPVAASILLVTQSIMILAQYARGAGYANE